MSRAQKFWIKWAATMVAFALGLPWIIMGLIYYITWAIAHMPRPLI
jgi:hypothetical protein